jgi:molybdopterin molybdotransferase
MISVSEAKKLISQHVVALPSVWVDLRSASGMVLHDDVIAPFDIPAFPQSSMDGYALSYKGWQTRGKLTIEGEVPAGSNRSLSHDEEKAIRIFTGAAVPDGADTVVMQEKVSRENQELIINDDLLKPGSNVRPKGSEIRAGAIALKKGTFLSSGAIGFLAGIGIDQVTVYDRPGVTLLITGNELQEPGKPLDHGQVYESNSFTLSDALKRLGIIDIQIKWVKDDLAQLTGDLMNALINTDVVLLTGGVSVGEYDFVLQASKACGVEQVFHKVRQRPGKPFFFGKKEQKLVFGLPGNPASVLTCFYEYVVDALDKMSARPSSMKTVHAPIGKQFFKKTMLTHFLKGYYDGKKVTPLDAQESYRMSSFASANCLIRIDEETTDCNEGDMVEIHLFPYV